MQHSPEEIAKSIAEGHAFDKHVASGQFGDDKRRGEDTGVRTRSDYEDKIKEVITSEKTSSFSRSDGGALFYDEDQNIVVAYDPKSEDLGSCFRPTSKDKYIDRCLEKDEAERSAPSKTVEADRPGATVGSASKPRDQEQVLKEAQDQQRDTPGEKLSPEQRRAALHEASAKVEKDQEALKDAWEREDDPKVKEQIALKAGIEQANFNRHAANERADLATEDKGPQSIEALRAKREAREAEADYDQGVAEWHKRSVRDSDYERYDDKWSREAERAEEREASSNETQAEKNEALDRQFDASASMSHGHSR